MLTERLQSCWDVVGQLPPFVQAISEQGVLQDEWPYQVLTGPALDV